MRYAIRLDVTTPDGKRQVFLRNCLNQILSFRSIKEAEKVLGSRKGQIVKLLLAENNTEYKS